MQQTLTATRRESASRHVIFTLTFTFTFIASASTLYTAKQILWRALLGSIHKSAVASSSACYQLGEWRSTRGDQVRVSVRSVPASAREGERDPHGCLWNMRNQLMCCIDDVIKGRFSFGFVMKLPWFG